MKVNFKIKLNQGLEEIVEEIVKKAELKGTGMGNSGKRKYKEIRESTHEVQYLTTRILERKKD